MVMMGGDFNFENANTYYKNIDKLLYYLNKVSECIKVKAGHKHSLRHWVRSNNPYLILNSNRTDTGIMVQKFDGGKWPAIHQNFSFLLMFFYEVYNQSFI